MVSMADRQPGRWPELRAGVEKEYKQGPWWAAVTQNLPAEEKQSGKRNTRGTLPPAPQAPGTPPPAQTEWAPGKQPS